MKGKKAQVFSGELFLAYIFFTLVLVVVVYLWGNAIKNIFESEDNSDLEGAAVDVSENLVRTPGMPELWNKTSVKTVGLANRSRNLNEAKLLDFVDLMNPNEYSNTCGSDISNYDCNKHLTGVGVYDFHFSLEYLNGSTVSINEQAITTGKQPVGETKKIPITRTSLLNETIVHAKVVVWR